MRSESGRAVLMPNMPGDVHIPDVLDEARWTTRFRSKYRVAIVVRTVAFFLIPLIYFLLAGRTSSQGRRLYIITGRFEEASASRRLLAAVGRSEEKSASQRPLTAVVNRALSNNCTPAAILEFPSDGLTRMQRKSPGSISSFTHCTTFIALTAGIGTRQGFVVVHCALAVYCCVLLAAVCEDYFVPAIEMLCAHSKFRAYVLHGGKITKGSIVLVIDSFFLIEIVRNAEGLQMSADVAGATLMAAASSSPELFISCVGTFVTEGDLGVGAVVGSAVFNVLAVPACCALLASRVVELDRWAVSRDCLVYALAVVVLVLALRDNVVYWHEALALVLMYAIYILAMVFNERLVRLVRGSCGYLCKPKLYSEITPLLVNGKCGDGDVPVEGRGCYSQRGIVIEKSVSTDSECPVWDHDSPLRCPGAGASCARWALWACTWPVTAALWATVPDCRRRPALCPLAFAVCVIWIGAASYLLAWIITILGDTLDVPDSVTGLTVLAAGTSLPEAVSSVLVTNRGHGTMGLSNSIGSNTFDILLCLGLPWLIKSLYFPAVPGNFWIMINSGGLMYSAAALLSTLALLYTALAADSFRLRRRTGVACALAYAAYLALAVLLELNVLVDVNPPVCNH
ncbi:Sodium/potassium/calcium exchanger 5 [Papilio machaon]|uniref:Sodium/potassium/calcium exchanger 5 n=1 Tax=Papilio machaon TaxID=76193 RepID=A0A194QVK3_PAPMA|nr:Sodium/potassium/calcium exchanger 5 [Papilio machaon]